MTDPWLKPLGKLPANVRDRVNESLHQFSKELQRRQLILPDEAEFYQSAPRVWYCSQFVAESCLRHPEMAYDLQISGDLLSARQPSQYIKTLDNASWDSEQQMMSDLRKFRRREMVRIAWRDLAGWAILDETLKELTALAETCIQKSLDFLYQQACQRQGIPTLSNGRPFNLVVLGMGKLGAWELNFSSDIDLIFAYQEDGVLPGPKQMTYGEFFTRICRSLVKALDETTVDGFVFRTDIRLRPFGDSGPLIMTFAGLEEYYLTQAREWERYAMIKARQVAGDDSGGQQLAMLIKPFVYRRYLDYGAFEELRALKSQITRELMRRDRMENIKLGPGGIREIEFIGQAFQLIRGGQQIELQQREILIILSALAKSGLMDSNEVETLCSGYQFLRQVENHLQQYQDKQTHDLPVTSEAQQILAFSMGYSDWSFFKAALDSLRNHIHSIFSEVFSLSEQQRSQQHADFIWIGNADNHSLCTYLEEYGYRQGQESLSAITRFKKSFALKRLSHKGDAILNRLLPRLIEAAGQSSNPDETLKRLLTLLEAIAGRTVYLSLLVENPHALMQLIRLSSASLWICEYLAKYPLLLDELLDARSLYEPLKKQELTQQLNREVTKVAVQDDEQLMFKLRQFKHLNVLRVAGADIMGIIPLTVVSDYLTYIAEVILQQVVTKAWQMLGEKHGYPPGVQSEKVTGFAVLGFGKLGSMELGYGSDLDMVFLYDCKDGQALTDGRKPLGCTQFYLRMGQKVRHILDTRMLSGQLYPVDLRLRPSGDSGLLVTHINSYENYLLNNAWTYEHQALVRGRFINGDQTLKPEFDTIRCRILTLPRNQDELKKQVRVMRQKMIARLAPEDSCFFNIKHSQGGIADIEFIVQFHILALASKDKTLVTYTDNIRLLKMLADKGFMAKDKAALLSQAFCRYRDYGHRQILQGKAAITETDEFLLLRQQIERLWHDFMD